MFVCILSLFAFSQALLLPDFTSMSMEDFISLDLDELLARDPPSEVVATAPEDAEVMRSKEALSALKGQSLGSITNASELKDAVSLILHAPDLGRDLRLLLLDLKEQLPVLLSMTQSAVSIEHQHSEYLEQRKK